MTIRRDRGIIGVNEIKERLLKTITTSCLVQNCADRQQAARVPKLLVETDSELSWISAEILKKVGVLPEKRGVKVRMPNGCTVPRSVGSAVIQVGNNSTVGEVVFALRCDLQIIGSRTLKGLNLTIDSHQRELVSAGRQPAA